MSNTHFKATATALANALDHAGITYDVYSLLTLTDTIVGQSFIDPTLPTPEQSHDSRVLAAIQHREVMGHMHDGKKINAIKELRAATACGLKEAKDAVEDHRIVQALERFRDYDGTFYWYRMEDLTWL